MQWSRVGDRERWMFPSSSQKEWNSSWGDGDLSRLLLRRPVWNSSAPRISQLCQMSERTLQEFISQNEINLKSTHSPKQNWKRSRSVVKNCTAALPQTALEGHYHPAQRSASELCRYAFPLHGSSVWFGFLCPREAHININTHKD